MKFMILGASGMAGHIISIYLTERGHDVIAFSRKPFPYCAKNLIGDVSDLAELKNIVARENCDIVVNCIGILNNFADENKPEAILMNSYLPHYLSSILADGGAKLIHLSTDCVFSGKTGQYTEASFPDGRKFYDRTKAIGEVTEGTDLTFRTSIIGPDINRDGIGLFNWFMKQQEAIQGYTGVLWTGVTTLTLAKAIEAAAVQDLSGLYHLVNNSIISKYELLALFNQYFKKNEVRIIADDTMKTNKSLINTRRDFKLTVPGYEEMVSEMRSWIEDHKQLYPHYFL